MSRRQRPSLNITEIIEHILADLCARTAEFQHVDARRLLCCLSRARQATATVRYAKIVPMRFSHGTPFKQVEGYEYALPQIPTPEGDVLYLIYLYVPRFFEQTFERRLLTLVHELYHIAPAFDGTIRRFGARAHGASRTTFNDRLQPMIQAYLDTQPAEELLEILRADFRKLAGQFQLIGRTLPLPRAVRLARHAVTPGDSSVKSLQQTLADEMEKWR